MSWTALALSLLSRMKVEAGDGTAAALESPLDDDELRSGRAQARTPLDLCVTAGRSLRSSSGSSA
jgi:hypothetical protein